MRKCVTELIMCPAYFSGDEGVKQSQTGLKVVILFNYLLSEKLMIINVTSETIFVTNIQFEIKTRPIPVEKYRDKRCLTVEGSKQFPEVYRDNYN